MVDGAQIMGGKIYTYPMYDGLNGFIRDEIIHYDCYTRFLEIMGIKSPVDAICSGFSEDDISQLKKMLNLIEIQSVDDYVAYLNQLIDKLFREKKIKIIRERKYYCENCDEYYLPRDVVFEERETEENVARVRIGRRLYFVGTILKNLEPVGIAINKDDTLLLVQLDRDRWVAPTYLKKVFVKDIEVPEENITEIKASDLKKERISNFVVFGDFETKFITNKEKSRYRLKGRISSYVVIYSIKKVVTRPRCPQCAFILQEIKVPNVGIVDDERAVKISSRSGEYRIPLLYCENCGNLEYGMKIRECPVCGNVMEVKFSYDFRVLPLGYYYGVVKDEVSEALFIHHKRRGVGEYLNTVARSIGKKWFDNTKVLFHDVADEMDEDKRCVFISKRRGGVTESDLARIRKFKTILKNLVEYIEIYGTRQPMDPADTWILYRAETVKKEILNRMRMRKFASAFNILYEFVVKDLSHFYVPLRRKEPLVSTPIEDALVLAYPYLPEFSKTLLDRLGYGEPKINQYDVKEETGIEVVRDIIKTLRKFRHERGITLREPLKKVVFVSDRAEDVKKFASAVIRMCNILVFNATERWDEMELDVEPNVQAIGKMYRAWAPKIAFLLKRKNVKEIMDALNKGGYTMGIEGFIVKITPEMVKFVEKVPKGYIKVPTKYGSLYINVERDLSTHRIRLINEVIRRINYMRKDIEMEYDDMIDVCIYADEDVMKVIRGYVDEIRDRTRARNVDFRYLEYAYVVEWPIMEYDVVIGINPLFKKWVLRAFQSIPGIAENKAEILFHMGYGSIYELMQASPAELAEIPGFSLNFANKIRDYLYRTAFKPKKIKGKEVCPFCGAELDKEDEFCPKCGAPIRVKIEEKGIEKGNVYVAVGEFTKILANMPPELQNERKLLITKEEPDEAKKIYDIKNTQIIWISYVPIGKSIKPKEIEKLQASIERFLGRGGKLILMDCFDFMAAINGVETMLEFLQQIREDVKATESLFLFNVEEMDEETIQKIMEYVDGKM